MPSQAIPLLNVNDSERLLRLAVVVGVLAERAEKNVDALCAAFAANG